MFKPTLKMLNVEAVGHYAIKIDWSDGHNTGIYSFDHLRKICPCASARVSTAFEERARGPAQSSEMTATRGLGLPGWRSDRNWPQPNVRRRVSSYMPAPFLPIQI